MTIRFYNTLTRKKQVFRPLSDKRVLMYNCGPTVYTYPHIGNYRAYVFADLLRRYLEYRGFGVKQIMNITDVDDKTIRDSKKAGESLHVFTRRFEKSFFEDITTLNIKKASSYPRATEHIPSMVKLIEKLLSIGVAYRSEDRSVYYNISRFGCYGCLSRLDTSRLKAGARVSQDEYEKQEAKDFALWKVWDKEDGNVFWKTSLGKGRPGWHIECSAMSMKHLGTTIDIHTGGIDNIFPHHENEIAQSEGVTGKPFVRYWLHCGHLLVDGKKMSKSLGNFYTLRDVLSRGYDPIAIRYSLVSVHYRQPLNFTFEGLNAATQSLSRVQDFILRLKEVKNHSGVPVKRQLSKVHTRFESALDDDLNISVALAAIFSFIREINSLLDEHKISRKSAKEVLSMLQLFDTVLGVLYFDQKPLPLRLRKLIEEREIARVDKSYERADALRRKLLDQGVVLEDTSNGVRWKWKKDS